MNVALFAWNARVLSRLTLMNYKLVGRYPRPFMRVEATVALARLSRGAAGIGEFGDLHFGFLFCSRRTRRNVYRPCALPRLAFLGSL